MKGSSKWSQRPYKPLMFDTGDNHICQVCPGEKKISLSWLPLENADSYTFSIKLRGSDAEYTQYTTNDTSITLNGLDDCAYYEFFVAAIDKKSRTRPARTIVCTLERKSVKNINLRVRRDGSVYVSANRRVPLDVIENFIRQNADRIIAAVDRAENTADQPTPDIPRDEIMDVFSRIFAEVFGQFTDYCRIIGVQAHEIPTLRIRLMKSRWGSCIPAKNSVTLNTRLIMYPRECIEYVIAHELCHLLEANHSAAFYAHLTAFMPDWPAKKNILEKKTS